MRTLTDAQICSMFPDELNSAARHYRPDLRASRDDIERAVELWNIAKCSTIAIVITDGEFPQMVIA